MCKTVLVKGPCWCNGNNGKRVTLREYLEKCPNVLNGGSHDEFELLFPEIKVVKSRCDKCPYLEVEADRLETEARERERMEIDRQAERVEVQRVVEEREAQVVAQGGYQGYEGGYQGGYEGGYQANSQADHQGGYQEGYQRSYQGGNQGSYQEAHRQGHRRVHRGHKR
ncbi:uncharacterized protein EAF01_009955 [Botrytis porri]|uniref:uncharacterized protein n=1 Tax=Botrytis porri TaxID=87229 RepID=UPI001900488A|nr:uncharacterized protein EAF01_009955 [Botrytis porri]KAF7894504.1 hypothetical protein EAF01_009955 [Botrytis porri]